MFYSRFLNSCAHPFFPKTKKFDQSWVQAVQFKVAAKKIFTALE